MKLQHIVLVTLSAVANCLGATVANIQTDVTTLTANIETFTAALADFDPAGFPLSAIGLALDITDVIQALDQSTTDAQALSHPVSDPTDLLAAVSPLAVTVPNGLAAIVAAKSQFEAIPTLGPLADGTVGGALTSLQSLAQTFLTAINAALPALSQPLFTPVENTINAAFTSSIGTFGADLCPS